MFQYYSSSPLLLVFGGESISHIIPKLILLSGVCTWNYKKALSHVADTATIDIQRVGEGYIIHSFSPSEVE